MANGLPELGKALRASSHEHKAQWSDDLKQRIADGVYDAIDALCHEAKNAKNSQARVAAARQVVRLAFVMGVLERDAMKEFLTEIGAELDQLQIG
jgi:hypothetical protein